MNAVENEVDMTGGKLDERKGLIAVLSMLMVVLSTAVAFWQMILLLLKSSYPKDGQRTFNRNLGG